MATLYRTNPERKGEARLNRLPGQVACTHLPPPGRAPFAPRTPPCSCYSDFESDDDAWTSRAICVDAVAPRARGTTHHPNAGRAV